ncbi:hypothetical protein BDAP_000088 [Binucleata daphniae]
MIQGGYDAVNFMSFFEELIMQNPQLRSKTFVLDNAKNHQTNFYTMGTCRTIISSLFPALWSSIKSNFRVFFVLKQTYSNSSQNASDYNAIKILIDELSTSNNICMLGSYKELRRYVK